MSIHHIQKKERNNQKNKQTKRTQKRITEHLDYIYAALKSDVCYSFNVLLHHNMTVKCILNKLHLQLTPFQRL